MPSKQLVAGSNPAGGTILNQHLVTIATMPKQQETEAVQAVMATLFSARRVLKALAPEFRWTYGGNLVGDFGEYMTAHHYGLTLAGRGSTGHDAVTSSGKTVQVKTNHSSQTIGFRGEADLMLAIRITDDGEFEELYFGEFKRVVENSSFSARDNKRTITVRKLKELAAEAKPYEL